MISHKSYRNNPMYWDILSTYHTCPKIWNSPFYYLLMYLKYCCMYGKQCGPWSDAAFCGIWSGSTLFAKVYLSQYLGLLWETHKSLVSKNYVHAQSFRKHAYSNIQKISHPKTGNFQKNFGRFHISAQNIDCGYSLNCLGEAVLMSTHNLCFWEEIRKIMYTPVNPSFTT